LFEEQRKEADEDSTADDDKKKVSNHRAIALLRKTEGNWGVVEEKDYRE